MKPDVRIIIAQRGWVFVGKYMRHDAEIVLTDAKNIRAWGTKKGLGELFEGPKSGTVLDEAGTVRLHPLQIIATLDVDDGVGPLHAGRVDGERWWVEMSALGGVIVDRHEKDREALKLVASSSIWFPTRGARDEQRDMFVDLCVRGFVSQRLSSIGEVDEKVHFSISDAGRKALAG